MPLTGHSALTADTILPRLGDAALGIVSVGSYAASIDTPQNRQFVREYESAYGSGPSRYSECGWIAAALIVAAARALEGDLSDRERVRHASKNALSAIPAPRGRLRFDAYRQAVTPIYVTRTEKRAGRVANIVIDTLPAVSQEATWGWWNKG